MKKKIFCALFVLLIGYDSYAFGSFDVIALQVDPPFEDSGDPPVEDPPPPLYINNLVSLFAVLGMAFALNKINELNKKDN